jgi:dsRNA-specific ribonuclease
MEHKGVRYEIVQTGSPTGFLWTVYLNEKTTKTGVSFSRENAVFNAERAIDKAIGNKSKKLPKT